MEDHFCVNCYSTGAPDVHGLCAHCGSSSIVSRHAERISRHAELLNSDLFFALLLLWRARCHLAKRLMDAGDRQAWLLMFDLSGWLITGEMTPTFKIYAQKKKVSAPVLEL